MSAPTEFMSNLSERLKTEKHVSQSTADTYVRSLYSLNGKTPFKNLAWLKKTDPVVGKIKEYAPSTQRALLATVVSVLSILGPSYKKALSSYTAEMNSAVTSHKAEPTGVKSEKQEHNWMSWDEVLAKQEALKSLTTPYNKKKTLTTAEWNNLLDYMVLSLYTEIPPRRNADYQLMWVAKKPSDDTSKNWLDLSGKRFVFNVYKTAKKYNQQVVDVPSQLMDIVGLYLKHHPGWKGDTKKAPTGAPFLVTADGEQLKAQNVITRILNRVLGKKVGASMLRHIYLTSKYGKEDDEREADARDMGHSVGQQKEYILTKGPKGDEDDSE